MLVFAYVIDFVNITISVFPTYSRCNRVDTL